MINVEAPLLQRAGALIDVMNALPQPTARSGHKVSVALPFYREILEVVETSVRGRILKDRREAIEWVKREHSSACG